MFSSRITIITFTLPLGHKDSIAKVSAEWVFTQMDKCVCLCTKSPWTTCMQMMNEWMNEQATWHSFLRVAHCRYA